MSRDRLSENLFKTVVRHTPLVSIDLIVRNARNEVLLGRRLNRPAKEFWFVPGGIVRKDELLAEAFHRLVKEEIGMEMHIKNARFIGPFEHFYLDNFSGLDFSTHYVVLAHEIVADISLDLLPAQQHDRYRWFTEDSLLESERVHQHTKLYFEK